MLIRKILIRILVMIIWIKIRLLIVSGMIRLVRGICSIISIIICIRLIESVPAMEIMKIARMRTLLVLRKRLRLCIKIHIRINIVTLSMIRLASFTEIICCTIIIIIIIISR